MSLVILDVSGSMAGSRYDSCINALKGLKDYDIWLFNDNVIKTKKIEHIGGGTNIANMLNELLDYSKLNKGKWIYILTDDESEYDSEKYNKFFKEIIKNNHTYVIFDICSTDMTKMKNVFKSCDFKIIKSFQELEIDMIKVQEIIQHDQKMMEDLKLLNIPTITSNVNDLKHVNKILLNQMSVTINEGKKIILRKEIEKIDDHLEKMLDKIIDCKNTKMNLENLKIKLKNLKDKVNRKTNKLLKINPKSKLTDDLKKQILKLKFDKQEIKKEITADEKSIEEIEKTKQDMICLKVDVKDLISLEDLIKDALGAD